MKTAASQKQTNVNGVNVEELFKTVDAVKKTAYIAKFRFRADNTWVDGGHNRTSIRNFYGAGGEDTSRKRPSSSMRTNRKSCWGPTAARTPWNTC